MLTTVYQETERQRQRKLRVARKERETIIAEEEERSGAKERMSEEVKLRGSESHSIGRVSNIPTAALTEKVQLCVRVLY